ncbi:MAG: flagellar filament capping protein FliD [Ignavibacteriales bacterium]|nr:flagellar filament capping protein FliD [Ignavibacteriales bacterium]
MDILSSSSISNLINSSKQSEYSKKISPLLEKKTKFTNLSSTWGNLKTKLSSLKSLLSDLKDVNAGGSFTAKATELSSEDYFSANASSGAALSTYDIRVQQLAKSDRVMSNTVSSSSSAGLSAGTYSFQVATGEYDQIIDVQLEGSETKDELMKIIAEAVNSALSDVVSASVFSPKNGESKLSIISKKSGSDNAITIKDETGNLLQSIGMNFTSRTLLSDNGNGGYATSQSALDSVLNLNGVTVIRGSNVIDDLISDVTLTLKNQMEEGIPTVNLIVKNNREAIKSDIEDLISSFNEAYSFVKNNYYADKDGQRGIFVGNATAIGLMQSFGTISYEKVQGLSDGNYSYLSEIGIGFDPMSGLSITDDDLLTDALDTNPEQVGKLFNSENGVANKLYDMVDSYIKNKGTISNLIDNYDNSVSYLNDKIGYKETQIDKNAEVLRKKYEQMQMQLAQIYSTQNSLSTLGIFS